MPFLVISKLVQCAHLKKFQEIILKPICNIMKFCTNQSFKIIVSCNYTVFVVFIFRICKGPTFAPVRCCHDLSMEMLIKRRVLLFYEISKLLIIIPAGLIQGFLKQKLLPDFWSICLHVLAKFISWWKPRQKFTTY